MNTLTVTATSLWTEYAAPTNVPPPPMWTFPNALNTTFIAQFDAQLPPSQDTTTSENGTTSFIPPSPFGYDDSQKDIILESIYDLTYSQRVYIPPDNGIKELGFGREDVIVRPGDVIAPDWAGTYPKTVGMACHVCNRYDGDGKDIFDACDRFSPEYGELMGFFEGPLTTDEAQMRTQFTSQYGDDTLPVDQPPQTFPPQTRFIMPQLSSSAGAAVCIFILDWDRVSFLYKHSVPFPVFWEPRLVGHDANSNPLYEIYEFNTTYPMGVSLNGTSSGSGNNGTNVHSLPPMYDPGETGGVKRGVVVGSVLGAVGAAAGLVVIAWLLWRRRRAQRRGTSEVEAAADGGSSMVDKEGLEKPSKKDALDSRSVSFKSVSSSVEVPPPTYSEATRDEITRL